jgi:hypothetical protein
MLVFLLACLGGAQGGDPMDQARQEAARALGVKASAIEVTTLDASSVPGVTLLGAQVSGRVPKRKFVPVAVVGSELVVGGDAVRQKVLEAWAWKPGQVDPALVAKVLTPTLELPEAPTLVADAERVTYLGRLGVEGVALPHEGTGGEHPAVIWWVSTGQNPATEVILTIPAGAPPQVTYGRSHGGG